MAQRSSRILRRDFESEIDHNFETLIRRRPLFALVSVLRGVTRCSALSFDEKVGSLSAAGASDAIRPRMSPSRAPQEARRQAISGTFYGSCCGSMFDAACLALPAEIRFRSEPRMLSHPCQFCERACLFSDKWCHGRATIEPEIARIARWS